MEHENRQNNKNIVPEKNAMPSDEKNTEEDNNVPGVLVLGTIAGAALAYGLYRGIKYLVKSSNTLPKITNRNGIREKMASGDYHGGREFISST